MTFCNAFDHHTAMTASASFAGAASSCGQRAAHNSILTILDAITMASIIITLITLISLLVVLSVNLLGLLLVLVLVVLLSVLLLVVPPDAYTPKRNRAHP
jgi:hypothetical protein